MIYNDDVFKTLYLCLTDKCNLNCEFCYIHNKPKENKAELELGDLIYAIKASNPQYVVITGGEPLLFPEKIISLQRYFQINDSCHWDTMVCSNLFYNKLTENQLKALSMVNDLQTSYSIDRELIDENIIHIISKNIEIIRKKCDNIKNISLNWTITPSQLNHKNYEEECNKLLQLNIDGINLETISYTKSMNCDWDKYYKESDEYILNCIKYIPNKKNMLFNKWNQSLDSHLQSLHCNMCSLGCAVTYDDKKIIKRCNCILERVERREKFINQCIDCDLYRYCKMDCERYGNYCGFPKETFKYFMKEIRKEEI